MPWNSTASEPGVPTPEEIHAAGRALQRGKNEPADRLANMPGADGRAVALHVLAAAVDYEPAEPKRRRFRG